MCISPHIVLYIYSCYLGNLRSEMSNEGSDVDATQEKIKNLMLQLDEKQQLIECFSKALIHMSAKNNKLTEQLAEVKNNELQRDIIVNDIEVITSVRECFFDFCYLSFGNSESFL